MPSSLRTFRLGRGDEDTLVTTSAFSRGAHCWYRWRPSWGWPCFETVRLQRQIGHQLLELPVLSLELPYLMLSGVPNRVTGQPLLARLHELFGPRVVGVGLDPLPPAQVVDCDLAAEALQNNSDLVSSEVYLRRAAAFTDADERPGLLASFLGGLCFAYG